MHDISVKPAEQINIIVPDVVMSKTQYLYFDFVCFRVVEKNNKKKTLQTEEIELLNQCQKCHDDGSVKLGLR